MKLLVMFGVLCLACGVLAEAPFEQVVGRRVMFNLTKDLKMTPYLPVQLAVVQEQGGLMNGPTSCDVVARGHEIEEHGERKLAVETVLKCGDGVFRVERVIFSK